jgi:hypothetical protein
VEQLEGVWRLLDYDGRGTERDAGDLAGRNFDLGGRNHLVCTIDARDTASHQLRCAQARHYDEFERVRTAGTLNHWNLLPSSGFGMLR